MIINDKDINSDCNNLRAIISPDFCSKGGVMLEKISIVFSTCISVASLAISILSYRLKSPKIKLHIMDKKSDCFFGNVRCEQNDRVLKSRVSGIRLRLINNSPNEISVLGIVLKCNKDIYRLIDCTNECWEIVEFVFPNANGEESSDGSAMYYGNEGVNLPLKLSAYDGKDIVALFHNFPVSIKKKARAKVIIQTTIGVKTKSIKLNEYDERYINDDYRDYLQYTRSVEVDKKQ